MNINRDCVILSIFDIEQGVKVRQIYPIECKEWVYENEEMIINHIIPDGSHRQNEDYNIILMNRDGSIFNTMINTKS